MIASNSNEGWAFTPLSDWNIYGWLSEKLVAIQNQDATEFLRFKS